MRSRWKGRFVDVSVIKQFDRTKNMCFLVYKLALRLAVIKIKKRKLNFPWLTPDRKIRVTSATINAIVLLRDVTTEIYKALSQESGIVIWSLRSTILLSFVGMFCQVYSGNKFISLEINRDMVNKKFGEFSLSKKNSYLVPTGVLPHLSSQGREEEEDFAVCFV